MKEKLDKFIEVEKRIRVYNKENTKYDLILNKKNSESLYEFKIYSGDPKYEYIQIDFGGDAATIHGYKPDGFSYKEVYLGVIEKIEGVN